MKSRISPEIEQIFEQLRWIECRRFRIVESVAAHFGRPSVEGLLAAKQLLHSPLSEEPKLSLILDERNPEDYIAALAFAMQRHEAGVIGELRAHVSVYRGHVDEQILFGSRTAGQEAGRAFLARHQRSSSRELISIPEAVQAVYELTYSGLPHEKNYFLMLRPQGSSSVHFVRSPHIEIWKSIGADNRFLFSVQREWMRGILDVLSPGVELSTIHAIEEGHSYGLEHFFRRGQHAGP